jgi:multiple sugar transport system substrate-binding protein
VAITLKGLAWDHRRCWGPLEASIAVYTAARPGLSIVWDRRSLYEFGEGRLEDAVRKYDLITFDHPFVGEVARDGLMLPFDGHLSDGDRRMFEAESVGKSWQSYQAGGKQWALPIDAAAQVASYRPDLLGKYADAPPATHEAVLQLGRRLRADGLWLGLPLVPTDAMCLILTGAALAGCPIGANPDVFIEEEALVGVIERLRELAALAHPHSWSWNPIRCYEHMVSADDVVYVPFAFGYVNYASRSDGPHLRFANIPASPPKGALLGGAGIGVSALSKHPEEAIAYAMHLCSRQFQRTGYVTAGGQPGMLSAWTDPDANQATRNFFADTLATLSGAYLRETHPGFVTFFRECASKAAAAIKGDLSPPDLASWLNWKHAETRPRAVLDRSFA